MSLKDCFTFLLSSKNMCIFQPVRLNTSLGSIKGCILKSDSWCPDHYCTPCLWKPGWAGRLKLKDIYICMKAPVLSLPHLVTIKYLSSFDDGKGTWCSDRNAVGGIAYSSFSSPVLSLVVMSWHCAHKVLGLSPCAWVFNTPASLHYHTNY